MKIPDKKTRQEVVALLMAAYAHEDGDLFQRGVERICDAYACPPPRIKFVDPKKIKPSLGVTDFGKKGKCTVKLILPGTWKRTPRLRFYGALEWAKTVVHELMHSFLGRYEEELVCELEDDWVADLKFSGRAIKTGIYKGNEGVDKPLENVLG